MGKKVREYKSGDFIFAKVKGYPAWPARVQKPNGKKYFVYFYGTGETANLPPNMIFDYAENKEKFLNKSVKRKDFNDGVRQIDHDFANNVPLEQVIGALADVEPAPADDTMNDSANDTVDDSAIADTTADETMDETANSTAVNDGPVDDSDETGALVIDEGKQKGRKSTPKTPATPKPAKEAKGRGRPKKEEPKEVEVEKEEEKKDEEIVSRSGRKIRPKRYMDEQTEENATLPSPAPKKRRGASPTVEKEKPEPKEKPQDKNLRAYNTVQLSELRELKEPFKSADPEREHILMTYLPSGAYCGVKLFQSRPTSFKNEASRLAWDKQAGSNAITLKRQLEKGQITPQSISAQLVMDLNVTDEQKAMLDKDRDLEIKKSRLHFLKTEIKLIELDAKIKTCLSLEKADTELCLKLIDEILELDLDALMLLKHPTCMETVKRMRVYVGNAPSWEMSESEALTFSKRALVIRNKADALFITMKDLFDVPEGLSFWEYFNERVAQFKACTAELHADKLLEMVHEPIEMSQPSCHTMKAAIDAANEDDAVEPEDAAQKKKATPAKGRKEKVNNTPSKTPLKRQSSRKQQQEEKEKEPEKPAEEEKQPEANDKDTEKTDADETPKEHDETEKINDAEKTNDVETEEADKEVEKVNDQSEKTDEKETEADEKDKGDSEKVEDSPKDKESNSKEKLDEAKSKPDSSKEKSEEKEEDKEKAKDSKKGKDEKNSNSDKSKAKEKSSSDAKNSNNAKNSKDDIKNAKDDAKNSKDSKDKDAKNVKAGDKRKEKKDEKEKSEEKEKVDVDEPRAKRSRESKKTDPPPRSPAKRKSKS